MVPPPVAPEGNRSAVARQYTKHGATSIAAPGQRPRQPPRPGRVSGPGRRDSVRRSARALACRPISASSAAAWTAVSSAPGRARRRRGRRGWLRGRTGLAGGRPRRRGSPTARTWALAACAAWPCVALGLGAHAGLARGAAAWRRPRPWPWILARPRRRGLGGLTGLARGRPCLRRGGPSAAASGGRRLGPGWPGACRCGGGAACGAGCRARRAGGFSLIGRQ